MNKTVKYLGIAALALLAINGKAIASKIKSISNAAQVGKHLIVDVRNIKLNPLRFSQ